LNGKTYHQVRDFLSEGGRSCERVVVALGTTPDLTTALKTMKDHLTALITARDGLEESRDFTSKRRQPKDIRNVRHWLLASEDHQGTAMMRSHRKRFARSGANSRGFRPRHGDQGSDARSMMKGNVPRRFKRSFVSAVKSLHSSRSARSMQRQS
jgi:hypothetical protein